MAHLVKESPCNVRDLGLIPGLGRSPGEGKGYPLQYSGLENFTNCIVHGVTKSQTRLIDFHFMAESKEELKCLLMKVKEESEKAGLKLRIQKTKIMASGTFMGNRWGNSGNSDRLYFLGLQNHCRW